MARRSRSFTTRASVLNLTLALVSGDCAACDGAGGVHEPKAQPAPVKRPAGEDTAVKSYMNLLDVELSEQGLKVLCAEPIAKLLTLPENYVM